MSRAERRRKEWEYKTLNKNSLEYIEGYKAGKREERGIWVMAIDNTKGIGEKLADRIMAETANIYKKEMKI